MATKGVCEICGAPVPEPSSAMVNGWYSGHLFENGKLVSVRCIEHKTTEDPRRVLLGERPTNSNVIKG